MHSSRRVLGRVGLTDLRLPAGLLAALLLNGCSVVLEVDNQCEVDADCAGRGFANTRCEQNLCVASQGGDGTPWGCLGNVSWEEAADTPKITIGARFARLIGEAPVAGAPAKLCPPLDVSCTAPLDSGTTDADGAVTLEGHYGFRGYTLVSPPPDYMEMATAILWSNPPRFEEVPVDDIQVAHLTSVGEVTAIASIIGTEPDEELGHIFGLTTDCNGEASAGVSLSVDTVSPKTLGYYLLNSVPSQTANETDAGGFGGFVNLPGDTFITVTATHSEHGRVGKVSVLVKPGHVTYVAVAPSPN